MLGFQMGPLVIVVRKPFGRIMSIQVRKVMHTHGKRLPCRCHSTFPGGEWELETQTKLLASPNPSVLQQPLFRLQHEHASGQAVHRHAECVADPLKLLGVPLCVLQGSWEAKRVVHEIAALLAHHLHHIHRSMTTARASGTRLFT